jgi:hypothetical protein
MEKAFHKHPYARRLFASRFIHRILPKSVLGVLNDCAKFSMLTIGRVVLGDNKKSTRFRIPDATEKKV